MVVDDHIFIFKRQGHAVNIHRENPIELADMLQGQVARGIPVADGRMIAYESQRLSVVQLRRRDAEDDSLAEKRQCQWNDARLIALIKIGIERIVERTVAPEVGKDEGLHAVGSIGTLHLVPLSAKHAAVTVFHLIDILE